MNKRYGLLAYFVISCYYLGVSTWVAVTEKPIDYPVYLLSAYGFYHKQNVYLWNENDFRDAAAALGVRRYTTPYRYSPAVAYLVMPFLFLPYRIGILVWSLLNGAATILAGELLARMADRPVKRWLIRASTWLFVPFLVGVYAGQANALAVLPACAALVLITRGRDSVAGFFLGISLLIKPLAVGFLAYAIFRARWRLALTASVVLFLVLVPTVWAFGAVSLHSVIAAIGDDPGLSLTSGYPPAQSLFGLAERWLTQHHFGWSVADDRSLALMTAWILSAVIAAITIGRCWPPLHPAGWSDLQLGLVMTAVLLVNRATWYHHYAVLILPLAVAVAASKELSDLKFPALSWLLICVFGVLWHALVGHTLLLDGATLGACLLWFHLLVRARTVNR